MKTIEETELELISAGMDTYARDFGQLIGGLTGWVRAHPASYVILGPGIGGLVALGAGVYESLI